MERTIYIVQSQNRIILSKPSSVLVNSKYIDLDRLDANFYRTDVIELATKIESRFSMKRAEDLFEIITDGDHGTREYVSQGIPFYTAINVQEYGFVSQTDLFITKEYEESLKRSRLEENCLLIVKTGVGTGTSCVTGKNVKEGNISADVGIFKKTKQEIDVHFISAFMNSKSGREFILRSSYGSTRNRLTIAELKNLKLPIPSIKIQNYIGNKVRKAEELREEAKQLMSQVYELINIHFSLDSFENEIKDNYKYDFVSSNYLEDRLDAEYYDPNLIKLFTHLSKMGFKFVNLGNVSRMVFTGENVESTWIAPNKKVPLIYIGNLEGYFVIPSDSEFIDENNVRNWEKSFAEFGDILFASRGSLDCLINRISVYFDEDKKGVITSNIIAVRLDQNLIRPGYVISVLKSIIGTYQIIKHSWGVAQKGLTANDVSKIVIPLLQINEQLEIEEKLIQSFKKLQEAKKLINEAKQDVEDLIEGKFDESKVSEGV